MFDAEFWVAVAFAILVGTLIYFRVHKFVLEGVDARRDRIKAELDEARRLKDEAHALLTMYQFKQRRAGREAAAIVADARAQAERIAVDAKARLEEFVTRRTKMAEARIAEAEVQALRDVRSAAADAAVAAAEKILIETTKGSADDQLIARGIKEVEVQLSRELSNRP